MPQSDPVVVPVTVDLTQAQTALSQFGQTIASLRSAGGAAPGVPPVPGAAPPPGAVPPGVVPPAGAGDPFGPTLRSLITNLSALDTSVQRLTTLFNQLAQSGALAGGGVQQPAPGVVQQPTTPGAPSPVSLGRGPQGITATQLSNMLTQFMTGFMAMAGFQAGVGGVTREIGEWVDKTKAMHQAAYDAAWMIPGGLGRGLGPSFYELATSATEGFARPPQSALERRMRAPEMMRGAETAFQAGMMPPLADMRLMAAVGLLGFGNVQAGFQQGAAGYQTYRSSLVPDMLGSLVALAKEQGLSAQEMIRQFQGLRGVIEGREGQFQRTPQQAADITAFQGMLTALPGQAGVGQGGVDLAQQMAGFASPVGGGIGQILSMRAYMRTHGGESPLGSVRGRVNWIRWSQDPAGWAETIHQAQIEWPGDIEKQALVVGGFGQMPMERTLDLLRGGPVTLDRFRNLKGRDQLLDAQRGIVNDPDMDRLLDSVGGQAEEIPIIAERNRENMLWLTRFVQKLQRIKAKYPMLAVAIDAIEGIATVLVGYVGWRIASRLLLPMVQGLGTAAAAVPAAVAAGGGAAATTAGAGLGVLGLARRVIPYALPTMGAADVAKDVYDWLTGGDPENYVELAAGGAGAVVGGTTGFLFGGPYGAVYGALTGYEVGKDIERGTVAGLEYMGVPARDWIRTPAARGKVSGLNPTFSGDIARMAAAAHAAGVGDISIFSGYRTEEHQRRLWEKALAKYHGNVALARKWVAPPGHSHHEMGIAADLRFSSPEAERWAHAHAREYGLQFRMGYEPWHIEPIPGRQLAAVREAPAVQETKADEPTPAGHPGGVSGLVQQILGEVHVFIHMDPSFHGKVTARGTPGMVVRRQE